MLHNPLKQLIRENNNAQFRLDVDNDKLLKKMMIYIAGTKISCVDAEMIRKDLIGMTMESEMRGVSLQDSLGGNEKTFCQELVANCEKKPLIEPLLNILRYFAFTFFIWTVMLIFMWGDKAPLNLGTEITLLFYLIVLSVLTFFVKPKISLEKMSIKAGIFVGILVICFGFIYISDRIFVTWNVPIYKVQVWIPVFPTVAFTGFLWLLLEFAWIAYLHNAIEKKRR